MMHLRSHFVNIAAFSVHDIGVYHVREADNLFPAEPELQDLRLRNGHAGVFTEARRNLLQDSRADRTGWEALIR